MSERARQRHQQSGVLLRSRAAQCRVPVITVIGTGLLADLRRRVTIRCSPAGVGRPHRTMPCWRGLSRPLQAISCADLEASMSWSSSGRIAYTCSIPDSF